MEHKIASAMHTSLNNRDKPLLLPEMSTRPLNHTLSKHLLHVPNITMIKRPILHLALCPYRFPDAKAEV